MFYTEELEPLWKKKLSFFYTKIFDQISLQSIFVSPNYRRPILVDPSQLNSLYLTEERKISMVINIRPFILTLLGKVSSNKVINIELF